MRFSTVAVGRCLAGCDRVLEENGRESRDGLNEIVDAPECAEASSEDVGTAKSDRSFLDGPLVGQIAICPHKVHLEISTKEQVGFWWSTFPTPLTSMLQAFVNIRALISAIFVSSWKFLQPGMTFFDVGAYAAGIYTLIAAKKLEKTGRIVAFEPAPCGFRRLKHHLHLNRISCAAAGVSLYWRRGSCLTIPSAKATPT